MITMGINTIVSTDPERISSLAEVDEVLAKITEYERRHGCRGGVVLKQNRQLGGSYRVVSEEEAHQGIKHPRTCEWYVEFYPRTFFEYQRARLARVDAADQDYHI
jgi:hypothetical protein